MKHILIWECYCLPALLWLPILSVGMWLDSARGGSVVGARFTEIAIIR